MRIHARSFYLSTRLLPRAKRLAIEALYAFFRSTDDAVDEGDGALDERRARLAAIRRDLAVLERPGERGTQPWFPALRAAVARFAIERAQLERVVRGCESDLGSVDVRTLAELEHYAGDVAGAVGRCVLPILGADDPDSLERAERLGIAMQLTNVLRDVEADRQLGRNYLPLHEHRRRPLNEVMASVAVRARDLYRETPLLAARLPNDGSRAALLMASTLYEGILDRVEARGCDPRAGRVSISEAGKLQLAARCLLAAYTGFATIK